MAIQLSIYLSVYLFIYLLFCLPINLSINSSIDYLTIYLPTQQPLSSPSRYTCPSLSQQWPPRPRGRLGPPKSPTCAHTWHPRLRVQVPKCRFLSRRQLYFGGLNAGQTVPVETACGGGWPSVGDAGGRGGGVHGGVGGVDL